MDDLVGRGGTDEVVGGGGKEVLVEGTRSVS